MSETIKLGSIWSFVFSKHAEEIITIKLTHRNLDGKFGFVNLIGKSAVLSKSEGNLGLNWIEETGSKIMGSKYWRDRP